MKKLILFAVVVLSVSGLHSFRAVSAHADSEDKKAIENGADSVRNDARHSVRKMKKAHRKAIGTNSITKDAADTAKDTGDDVSTAAKKTFRKAQ